MFERFTKFFKVILLIGDLLLLNFAWFLSSYIKYQDFDFLDKREYQFVVLFANIMWLLITEVLNVYRPQRSIKFRKNFEPLIQTILFHLYSITFFLIILKFHSVSRLVLFYAYSLFLVLVSVWRIIFLRILGFIRKLGLNLRNVVILGAGPVGEIIMKFFTSEVSYGYNFLGFFDDTVTAENNNKKILGKIEDVKVYALSNRVDEIYCALPDYAAEKVTDIIHFAEENFIRFKIIPDFKRYVTRKIRFEFYDKIPIISLREEPLEFIINRIIKRLFDLIFSSLIIVLIFPLLFLVLGIWIKIDSPGPVLFKQYRWGKKNKRFLTYKFRSMVTESTDVDQKGRYRQASKDDPRITHLGHFLRKTNLDEFPQFWNVLIGDMSIVGPRPHPEPLNEQSMKQIFQYSIRHWIKPGITGFAQVKGYRGETKEPEMMKKRVEHDIFYFENWSIWFDISIILQTITHTVKGDKKAF